jgi:hypothetical protein
LKILSILVSCCLTVFSLSALAQEHSDIVVISDKKQICVKPKGADKRATFVDIFVQDYGSFQLIEAPFGFDGGSDSILRKYSIAAVKMALQKYGRPVDMTYPAPISGKTFVGFSFINADSDHNSLTIQVGPNMESFDCTPVNQPDVKHKEKASTRPMDA